MHLDPSPRPLSSSRGGAPASAMAAAGAAAVGLAWFAVSGGAAALSPVQLGWLLGGGDPAQHWLGWAYFRAEPWSWPLGALPRFAEPLGTTVGFMDAIPLAAIAAKPFAPLLPPDFQYLGPWLGLCFALQGVMGARIAAAMGAGAAEQLLAGALFALAPPLLRRVGHEALCAHWILLGLIALALRRVEAPAAAWRGLAAAGALACLAAAVHPTLALQALALAAAVGASTVAQSALRPGYVLAWLAAVAAGDVGVLALFGYFGVPLSAGGFGYFGADLLALVNPMGWSHLLPSWPTRTPGQAEGFAYLGAGGLLLVALGAAAWRSPAARVPWRRVAPVVVVATVLALFAASTYVTFAGRKLFGTSDLGPVLQKLLGPFRASGRFIWPLHYLALAAGIAGTRSLFGRRTPAVLAAAVLLQVGDVGPWRVREHFEASEVPQVAGWEAAAVGYRHLALVPPRLRDGGGGGCGADFGSREVALAYRAYRLGLGFNSGYLARMDLARGVAACTAQREELARGRLRRDTVYVPDPEALPLLTAAGATCGRIADETVCVAPDASSPLPTQRATVTR